MVSFTKQEIPTTRCMIVCLVFCNEAVHVWYECTTAGGGRLSDVSYTTDRCLHVYIILFPICRMSHHVYPQNPAVPLRDSAVTNTQQYSTMHPGHTSSGHPNATGNFAAPSRDYGSQQQSRTGGRHSVGPAYPVPPATQVHCVFIHMG